jgi:hypothetical protein
MYLLSGAARPLVPPEAVPALLFIKDTYGAFLLLLMQVNLSMTVMLGPLGFVFAPFILLSVALNAVPYILLSLAVDTNLDNTVKNEAASALRNLDKFAALQKLPGASIGLNVALAGQLGTMNDAARIFRSFLAPVAAGQTPGPETIAATLDVLETMKDVEGTADLVGLVKTADSITGGAVYSKAVRERAAAAQAAQNAKVEGVRRRLPSASTMNKAAALKEAKRKALAEIRAKAAEKAAQAAQASRQASSPPLPVRSASSTPLLLGAAALVGLFVLARRR